MKKGVLKWTFKYTYMRGIVTELDSDVLEGCDRWKYMGSMTENLGRDLMDIKQRIS